MQQTLNALLPQLPSIPCSSSMLSLKRVVKTCSGASPLSQLQQFYNQFGYISCHELKHYNVYGLVLNYVAKDDEQLLARVQEYAGSRLTADVARLVQELITQMVEPQRPSEILEGSRNKNANFRLQGAQQGGQVQGQVQRRRGRLPEGG